MSNIVKKFQLTIYIKCSIINILIITNLTKLVKAVLTPPKKKRRMKKLGELVFYLIPHFIFGGEKREVKLNQFILNGRKSE